jgi:hypothetical protein
MGPRIRNTSINTGDQHQGKEKDGEENVRSSPIRECHVFTRVWLIDASA